MKRFCKDEMNKDSGIKNENIRLQQFGIWRDQRKKLDGFGVAQEAGVVLEFGGVRCKN